MELSQGEKRTDSNVAPSSAAASKNGADQPPTPERSKHPTPIPDHPTPPPDGGPAQENSPEDTASIKPGDELFEAIRGAGQRIRIPDGAKPDTMIVPGAGRMAPAPMGRHTGPLEDRKAAYRHWLEGKSKDDLIDLLMGLEGQQFAPEHTDKLSMRPRLEEAAAELSRETYQIPDDLTFVRLPAIRRTPVNSPIPTWRVVLVALDQGTRPIGLQIDSEITVGRTAGDATPDLDLTPFGAKSKGVSRLHARLRPELGSLMLVDNNSSNGTFWNKIRLPANADQPLKDGDVITFGRVNFLVKIVKPPSMRDTKTLL